MTSKLLLPLAFLLVSCAPAAPSVDDHSMHSDHSSMGAINADLDRLNDSPRHQEWVEVKNGGKTIHTFVVYPQTSEKVPVVVLIHENKGLNDWARSMADQVAEAGYIAVAPDLLSGFSATETRTSDFATPDAATAAIGKLNKDAVQADLDAVADWAKTIPAADGKLASAGFCWGGGQSFTFATKRDDLAAAMVFYGTGPQTEADVASVSSPVFGFYGGADERVNATIDGSEKAMEAAGKTYEYEIYKGAGHAFMRLGEDPNGTPENVTARKEAFERMKEILSGL